MPARLRNLARLISMAVIAVEVGAVARAQSEIEPEPPPTTEPAVQQEPADEPPGDPRTRARHSEPAIAPRPSTPTQDSFLPARLRPLMPYLQLANRFGTHALRPGALIESDPISQAAQAVKTELGKAGVRYSFEQNIVVSGMTNRVQGDPVIGAYSYDFFGNWTVFEADELGGTCGWLSAKFVGDIGFGVDLQDENPRANIGAVSSPNNNYHRVKFAVEELAWAESFADGELVVLVGLINQTNYLDINRYANSSRGQLVNAALVNSQVIPAPGNNLGVNVQWQPVDAFYTMLGVGPNNQALGSNPFRDVSSDNFSYVGELGFVVADLAGLGPGTYRVQPFAATFEGDLGEGIAFNLEQQLGSKSPLGAFLRVGYGDDETGSVPGSVKAQASAGLAMQAPFGEHGLFSALNKDYAGLGFVWTKPVDDPGNAHDEEYAVELTLVLQLTPTATIQPDFQLVWDPINNPDGGPSALFQLQLNVAW